MGEAPQFRALAFADALTSGLTGQELADVLRHHFADISRTDVFLAVRFACSAWVADLLIANSERDSALVEARAVRLDLELAQIELNYLRRQINVMHGRGVWLAVAAVPDPPIPEAAHG